MNIPQINHFPFSFSLAHKPARLCPDVPACIQLPTGNYVI